MGRGDVRAAVLALLAEQPMHGYQIISEIDERSGGAWKPSAGSVYPTLQLLADEGLISAEEADGRKTYSLTEAGRAEAEASADRSAPWETPERARLRHGRGAPEGRHRARTGGGAGAAHGHSRAGQAGGRGARRRASSVSTRSSLRTDLGALGTSASRRLDARRRQHARPLPADPAVRRAIHRADVVVRARPAAHRPGEGRGARARSAADAHRPALPRARGRPRRPHDQGRPVPVVATRRAAARDHEGARRAPGRSAARAVRRDPTPRRGRAGPSARARVRVGSTRHRWPRHPSVKRTAPGSRRSTPPTPGSTRPSSRCSDRASRRSSTSTCAALRRVAGWLSRVRFVSSRVDLPSLVEEFAATSLEEIDYLQEAANAERFAANFAGDPRVAAPEVVWERTTRRVLTLADVTAIKINDREALRGGGHRPEGGRASSSRPSCSTSSSATASSTPTRTPATSSSRRSSGADAASPARA